MAPALVQAALGSKNYLIKDDTNVKKYLYTDQEIIEEENIWTMPE